MKFKANVPNAAPMTPRAEREMKYNRSRYNLLLVAIISVINLFTLALNGSYFLFSATIPAIPVELTMPVSEEQVVVFADFIVPIVIGIVLTVPYILCFFFSKKRPGWMIAALVFFSLDCLALFALYDLTSVIIDILFHAWVMFYLITGVINGFKLKKMPEDEPLPEFSTEAPAEDTFDTFDQNDFNYETPRTEGEDRCDRGDAFVAKEDKE